MRFRCKNCSLIKNTAPLSLNEAVEHVIQLDRTSKCCDSPHYVIELDYMVKS